MVLLNAIIFFLFRFFSCVSASNLKVSRLKHTDEEHYCPQSDTRSADFV